MFTLEQIKENRRKWVEALRSGKYRQTRGMLRRKGGGMCCLGVLADIAGCEWRNVGDGWEADGSHQVAPDRAMDFVRLNSTNGEFVTAHDLSSLAQRNDNGAKFPIIASIIESAPPGLFLTDEEIASLNTGKART